MATLFTSYGVGESNDVKMEEGGDEKAREAVQRPDRAPSFYFTADKEVYCYAGHKITIISTLDSYAGMVWPAALAFCQYLETKQLSLWDKAVLELGAGTGLVSIVATLLGAWVTATDLEDTLSNLRCNLSRNTKGQCRYTPQVAVLPWGYDLESTYPKSVYNYDYVLATDVVYHHDYLDELLATMKHFCQPGTTLIWANQMRFEIDLTFTEKFKKAFHTELLVEDGDMKIFMATCREGETEDNLVEETQGRLHEEQREEEKEEGEREEEMGEKEKESTGGVENKEYCVKEVKELGQNLLTNGMEKCPEWLRCGSTAENMADEAVPNSLNEDRTENNSKQAQERIDYKEQDEEQDECSQASVQNLEPEEERCKDTETQNNDSTRGTLTNQDEDTGRGGLWTDTLKTCLPVTSSLGRSSFFVSDRPKAWEETKDTEAIAESKPAWAPMFYTTFGKDIYYYVGEKINIRESIDSYGAVMWPAALALCYYLDNSRQKVNLMRKAVLELGAGTGLVTIVASLLGASATATDLPDVLGNLKFNVMRNTKRCRRTPEVSVLSWGYDLERTHPKSAYHYDYVLAADVVYHHDYLDELLATMKHFCQPGTTLIWANKVRYEADLTFTEKFKRAFHTELLVEDGEMKIFMATCREGETAVQQQGKPVWAPTVHSRWGNDIYYYVGEKITIHESIDSYGAVMWPAALALCYNLDNNSWQNVNLMGKEVLELGAGTGLVTIVASLLGARVTATDLPDVLSNLRDNVTRNTRERCRHTPEVSVLSWGYNLQRTHPKSVYYYDYVLAADVVYHHDYLDELLATMKHFCQPGTTLIWANMVRFSTDLKFTDNFKKAFHTELLFEDGDMKIFIATCQDYVVESHLRRQQRHQK